MDIKTPVLDGSIDIVVAVDPFTRWIKIVSMPIKSTIDVVIRFHDQVFYQYGDTNDTVIRSW